MEIDPFIFRLSIFILSIFIGYYVVWSVTPSLHTPLMSDRQWASGLAVGGAGPVISGSPASVANQLNDWFITSGLDGFNLAYTVMPECVDDFVDLVVPQLQEMGVFKTSYRHGSFREKLFGRSARLTAPHIGSTYTR